MGYTHYWNQLRNFTAAEWQQVSRDVRAILAHAEHRYEIRLCDGAGERGTRPEFYSACIAFNGSGDESHETMSIDLTRPKKQPWQDAAGFGFCKTARKPYDAAVAAVLCYLSAFHLLTDDEATPVYRVSSDGSGRDFLAGLELARQALPRFANRLDIPLGVMEGDRWCGPWINLKTKAYSFDFCIDGYAYVTRTKDGATFRFHSHRTAAEFALLRKEKPIAVEAFGQRSYEGGGPLFQPTGCFEQRRNRALARQQAAALSDLFDFGWDWLGRYGEAGHRPPAFVRPDEMPPLQPAYDLSDLLKEGEPTTA